MPGRLPHYKTGPASYQVSALVIGGQLVQSTSANATTVMPCATSASLLVLGVAGNDASPIVSQAAFVDANAGNAPLVDISVLPDYTAVYRGVDIGVTYEAACSFGAQLMAAATAGNVKAWDGTTVGAIIGRCTQPGGVLAGATVARALIY
jgi:hypothetical protein